MASRSYPTDILEQTVDTLAACRQINPELQAGPLTQAALGEAISEAQQLQSQIASLELQLSDLRTKREAQLTNLWDIVKRVRNTVKGLFGDDSAEYKLVGGTRLSDRRRPVRRTQP